MIIDLVSCDGGLSDKFIKSKRISFSSKGIIFRICKVSNTQNVVFLVYFYGEQNKSWGGGQKKFKKGINI